MSFTLKPITDIQVDVSIDVPGADKPSTLTARWRLHPFSEQQRIYDRQKNGEMTDDELVQTDLLDLQGVQDEAGESIDFTPELLSQLMDLPYVRRPLVLSWFQAQQGRAQAAAKN